MYTEKSAVLKNDFYSRYGEMSGELYFERIGLPCVLLEGTERKLAFALGCGIRAYGRRMGDVLRILDADSDTCRVHFMQNGMLFSMMLSHRLVPNPDPNGPAYVIMSENKKGVPLHPYP